MLLRVERGVRALFIMLKESGEWKEKNIGLMGPIGLIQLQPHKFQRLYCQAKPTVLLSQ